MPYYRVLMTREATESASVVVQAKDKSEAYDKAREAADAADWETNDNYRDAGDIYLGAGLDDDVDRITKEEARADKAAPQALSMPNLAAFERLLRDPAAFQEAAKGLIRATARRDREAADELRAVLVLDPDRAATLAKGLNALLHRLRRASR